MIKSNFSSLGKGRGRLGAQFLKVDHVVLLFGKLPELSHLVVVCYILSRLVTENDT